MEKQIFKGAGVVGGLTLASRILGFVRDAAIAWVLGAGPLSDAFFVAFRIPDLLRKFLSDGVLSLSFIPLFSEGEGRKKDFFETARSALIFIFFVAGVLVAFGVLFAPLWVQILAPGLPSETQDLAIFLFRIMILYLFWVLLLAVTMGVLNTCGHFLAPAASPALLNIVILFFTLGVSPLVSSPVVAISMGVSVGGFFQLFFQVPFLISRGFEFSFNVNHFRGRQLLHSGVLQAFVRMFPAVIGAAGFHINLLIATLMASFLGRGSISYLYYADRLLQFPMALVSVSLSVVALPELAKRLSKGEKEAAASLFLQGLSGVVWVIFPAAAGLIILREPIVSLLFFQGAFDLIGVKETASVLLFFCPGLCAMAGNRFLITRYCAGQDMTTPFKAGLAAVIVNALLSWPFMKLMGMGHQGLALAISCSCWLNLLILFWGLKQDSSRGMSRAMLCSFGFFACRSLCASGIMAFVVHGFLMYLTVSPLSGKGELFSAVAGCVIMGMFVYTVMFWFLGKIVTKRR